MRDDVHDMTVALDNESLGHFDAAIGGDPADIIAPEIEEHEMFSNLFLVGQQVSLAFGIDYRIAGAWPRACNRANGHAAVTHAHQDFRTGSNQAYIA